MTALLIFDIDNTLCLNRPVTAGFEAWEASIVASHPEPHPRALVEVPALLAAHPRAVPYLLTARHSRLRGVTSAWIAGSFPGLEWAHLSMLSEDGPGEIAAGLEWSRRSKLSRLAAIRARHPGLLVLIDDDPEMSAAIGAGDTFVLAW